MLHAAFFLLDKIKQKFEKIWIVDNKLSKK
jgi:hypothetical protein